MTVLDSWTGEKDEESWAHELLHKERFDRGL